MAGKRMRNGKTSPPHSSKSTRVNGDSQLQRGQHSTSSAKRHSKAADFPTMIESGSWSSRGRKSILLRRVIPQPDDRRSNPFPGNQPTAATGIVIPRSTEMPRRSQALPCNFHRRRNCRSANLRLRCVLKCIANQARHPHDQAITRYTVVLHFHMGNHQKTANGCH